MRKPRAESAGSSTASQPQACPDGVGVRLGKMPCDRIHPASDSIQPGAKASFNSPASSQYKPKFWNKSFPTPPSEKLPGSRQCFLPSLQQEAQLASCRCAPGGHWMQGIDRWILSICPLHNHSTMNRRHFSAPQKLQADCEKEMLDGGVPGTTVREREESHLQKEKMRLKQKEKCQEKEGEHFLMILYKPLGPAMHDSDLG
ncbi:uncharacterized protein LOC134738695 isoform X4 [Pongo pygmaeus]|uniref:uncharacterized protein LOC134738695 isoform X2 n=1 Tax=Pongo pygmaeus TaxID=9600 RepID=UPI00300D5F3C